MRREPGTCCRDLVKIENNVCKNGRLSVCAFAFLESRPAEAKIRVVRGGDVRESPPRTL